MHLTYVNIGCGSAYHSDWINLDIASPDSSVMAVNISDGLPFPPATVDACYSSHVLEHLGKHDASNLLNECMRVLKNNGTLRLVVPDLEMIVREYIRILDAISQGKKEKFSEYDWILLEMYDQTVRNNSGGEMASFLKSMDKNNSTFVRSRIGVEADKFWATTQLANKKSWFEYLARKDVFLNMFNMLRQKLAGFFVLLFAGKQALKSFEIGLFKNSGEIHQWMYDKYSLTRLLEQAGFVDVKVCSSTESRIPGFADYSLDNLNGVVRKPDSLFIEASKP